MMAAKKSAMPNAKLYVAYWRKFRELVIAFLKEAERWKLFDNSAEIPSMPGVKKWHQDERGRWAWTERPKTADDGSMAAHSRYRRSKLSASAIFSVWQELDQHSRSHPQFVVQPCYHPEKYAHSAQVRQVGKLFSECRDMSLASLECDTSDMKGVITRLPIELREQLGIIVNLLEPFVANSPPTKNAALSDDSAFADGESHHAQPGKKKLTTNELMRLTLLDKPESKGWSVTEWQQETKRSRGSVGGSDVWNELEAARKLGKSERRKDRRHRRLKNV